MKAVIESKAVEAPVCAKDQQDPLVILLSRLQGCCDFLFSVSIVGIQLAQFCGHLILTEGFLLCVHNTCKHHNQSGGNSRVTHTHQYRCGPMYMDTARFQWSQTARSSTVAVDFGCDQGVQLLRGRCATF